MNNYSADSAAKVKTSIKTARKKSRIWFPDMQFIHRKLQNPQGKWQVF